MSLIQLVALGSHNQMFRVPRNLAVEYFTESFNNGILEMSRDCDTKLPEFLELELSPNVNIETFKTITHKVCFEMSIGGSPILSIPLRFMMHLKEYEVCENNQIYITIPFELFCGDIQLLRLQYHTVRFTLTNIEDHFASCKLISKGTYYDGSYRYGLIVNNHEEIIQQLSSIDVEVTSSPLLGEREFKYVIPFHGMHKGFYIECENVNNIKEISLKLNGHDRFSYKNRFMMGMMCKKVSQQLLYLPMNIGKFENDRTSGGFEGAINLSRIGSTLLTVKFERAQSRVCLYGLGSNILKTMSGMGGLAFGHMNCHHSFPYQENGQYILLNNVVEEIVQPVVQGDTGPQVVQGDTGPQGYTEMVQPVENIIYKAIMDDDKLICCISQENIRISDRYMNCVTCNNNFNDNLIQEWFRVRPQRRRTCPMCRVIWTDFNIYINSVEA